MQQPLSKSVLELQSHLQLHPAIGREVAIEIFGLNSALLTQQLKLGLLEQRTMSLGILVPPPALRPIVKHTFGDPPLNAGKIRNKAKKRCEESRRVYRILSTTPLAAKHFGLGRVPRFKSDQAGHDLNLSHFVARVGLFRDPRYRSETILRAAPHAKRPDAIWFTPPHPIVVEAIVGGSAFYSKRRIAAALDHAASRKYSIWML